MSERMRKLIELGEDLRQNDIELGRRLERERILSLLEDYAQNETWSWNHLLRKITGEN